MYIYFITIIENNFNLNYDFKFVIACTLLYYLPFSEEYAYKPATRINLRANEYVLSINCVFALMQNTEI